MLLEVWSSWYGANPPHVRMVETVAPSHYVIKVPSYGQVDILHHQSTLIVEWTYQGPDSH